MPTHIKRYNILLPICLCYIVTSITYETTPHNVCLDIKVTPFLCNAPVFLGLVSYVLLFEQWTVQ